MNAFTIGIADPDAVRGGTAPAVAAGLGAADGICLPASIPQPASAGEATVTHGADVGAGVSCGPPRRRKQPLSTTRPPPSTAPPVACVPPPSAAHRIKPRSALGNCPFGLGNLLVVVPALRVLGNLLVMVPASLARRADQSVIASAPAAPSATWTRCASRRTAVSLVAFAGLAEPGLEAT